MLGIKKLLLTKPPVWHNSIDFRKWVLLDYCTSFVLKHRLHNEVEVSLRFTPPRAAGQRWCKKHRDRTEVEVCN